MSSQRTVREQRALIAALTVLFATVAAGPVLTIVGSAFTAGAGETWAHLASTALPTMIGNTFVLIVLVGIGVTMGGAGAGWLVARRRFPGSAIFEWALLLPLAMPAYVMAYAYTDFLQFAGPVQTWLRTTFGWVRGDYWFPDVRSVGGAAVLFVFALYPYVYLLARVAFLERPPALVEAARTLGLGRWAAFWHVEVPLARPAIVAGASLALMETLADFGTVAYFGVETFTTGIYRAWFSLGDRAAAAQLATALLGFVVATVALERTSRGRQRAFGSPRGRATSRFAVQQLRGWRAAAASTVCTIAVVVGFALPAVLLGRIALLEPELAFSPRFFGWAWNSVYVSAIASALVVVGAVLVGYAVRLAPGPVTRGASRAITLGYAVPGTVLAVGVLLPLGTIDNLYAEWRRAVTGVSPGLVLTGSVVALVYAYAIRYFAVGWNAIEPGFARITPSIDAASRGLGEGVLGTLRRVHAPLLGRSAAAAALLVFVDVMKELPATLVLRPFNFDTLATQAYQLAKDERLAEAALPSFAIVLAGLVPIVLLARMARRDTVRREGIAGTAPAV